VRPSVKPFRNVQDRSDEKHGGNTLRKAIDYFCHLAIAPDFLGASIKWIRICILRVLSEMRWLADVNEDHLRPVLHRHATRCIHFTVPARENSKIWWRFSQVANFETKQYEETIAAESSIDSNGSIGIMNQTTFDRFTMISGRLDLRQVT